MATRKPEFTPYQYCALKQPYEHFSFFGGVAAGKTYTGSHFVIDCIEKYPGSTGLIGSNTYDQLSQASLRELFYWFDHYGYEYTVDCMPPVEWGLRREFKTYKNVIIVKAKEHKGYSVIFTRIMSSGNPLRGIEFTWYWLDETRDTPQNTHDVVISRLRENFSIRKGLITSTTNGEDWNFQRFVRNNRPGQRLYGSMHIPTLASVKCGIISMEYYQAMRSTYSELMAMQELDALHVNVTGGRAYYAFSSKNQRNTAPWGDRIPDKNRPLIVGADFNFSPSPCVWMVGQLGPNKPDGLGGWWSDHIHWFGEISATEISTPGMTRLLLGRYPGFLYRIFGDASGGRGTTSNAGQHDYSQIAIEMGHAGAIAQIDYDQANPMVKDRVENMNRLAMNALGETHMTYDPYMCPLFDSDVKQVGWKQSISLARSPRLDNGGNLNLTHASDGAGYAAFKLLPLHRELHIGMSVQSIGVASMSGEI